MKKLFNGLILFGLLLAVNVKADMGPPTLPSLKAEIVNDGAKCYEDFELSKVLLTFNKGDVILVDNYGSGYSYYDEKSQESCFIKPSDLNFNKEKYELKREDRADSEISLLIVNADGVEMYKGPSEFYDKEGVKIPKGTELKTRYSIGDYWYYVTYNDVSGYISSENNTIVTKYDDYTKDLVLLTTREISITIYGYRMAETEEEYEKLEKENKVLGTIPANTEIKDVWSTDYTRNFYLTYNGVTGFIPGSSNYDTYYAYKASGKIKPLTKMDIYEDITYDNNANFISKKIGTIEANKEYEVSYSASDPETDLYYLPELKGWVYYNFDEKHGKDNYIFTDSKGEVYDSRERTEKHVLESIDIKNHPIEFKKDTYVYTIKLEKDEKKLEFVITPSEDIHVEILNNEALENGSRVTVKIEDDETAYNYIFNVVKPVGPSEPKKGESDGKLSSNTILLLCLGGALLMVITTIVIIILVNKSRKKKEEVVVENNIEDTEENTNENKL